ncbi:thrombospondin-2 [Platysternon megacephalum]|uniref:Thrombospondin-2 n=1 Tax=Platysternon megacephalum TaxID=55544 RepID=A0A4D9EBB2_9SAUR|nr:thrombospondin-2 [Platysternon megacephalum]
MFPASSCFCIRASSFLISNLKLKVKLWLRKSRQTDRKKGSHSLSMNWNWLAQLYRFGPKSKTVS